jgi:hypothetical protein
MRHPFAALTLLAAVTALGLLPGIGLAQGQSEKLPLPPGGFKPPPPAPVKPYKPVAIKPPTPFADAGFVALRKQLADVAQHKDRAALAKLVVAQGFFWMQDKDLADKQKPGIDNLAKAIDLDAKDGSGWDVLAGFADEATAAPWPDRPGVMCAPANPEIDPKAFEALLDTTQTNPAEWGYPMKDGLEVRSAPKPDAPATEKLGMTLVRVIPAAAPPGDANQAQTFLPVVTPTGKTGFVAIEAFAGLGGDEMCYSKDAGGWKITGYFGGAGE